MGIFSRFGEIINSNINAMLDMAEDPEKMLKLMIHEMEDTLTEVKSSAAEVVAERIRVDRNYQAQAARAQDWESKAQLAVEKGREDLAREALEQKRECQGKADALQNRLSELENLVKQYHADIAKLEDKLAHARNRQRILVASHKSAVNRKRVEEKIYKLHSTGAFAKFENYERRIDQYQAEAEIFQVSNDTLEKKFQDLVQNEAIEAELAALKAKVAGQESQPAKGKSEKKDQAEKSKAAS